jgi:hypothetical protein
LKLPKAVYVVSVLIFFGALVCAIIFFITPGINSGTGPIEWVRSKFKKPVQVIGQHILQNTNYLKYLPVAMFPEPPQRYLIRSIDSKNPDFLVALIFPKILDIDELGGISYDDSDKKIGVQLALVMIRNRQPNFYVSEFLEGYRLNPADFSNVGVFQKSEKFDENPKRFLLFKGEKIYQIEIGDRNLTQIKSINVDGIGLKLKKPVDFDQLALYLK